MREPSDDEHDRQASRCKGWSHPKGWKNERSASFSWGIVVATPAISPWLHSVFGSPGCDSGHVGGRARPMTLRQEPNRGHRLWSACTGGRHQERRIRSVAIWSVRRESLARIASDRRLLRFRLLAQRAGTPSRSSARSGIASGVPASNWHSRPMPNMACRSEDGRRDVLGERRERVLDDGDAVATARQLVVNAPPAGPVGKRAVHQHHIPGGRCLGGGWRDDARQGGRGDEAPAPS